MAKWWQTEGKYFCPKIFYDKCEIGKPMQTIKLNLL